ncbi:MULTISPECIES: acyl-CoA dehydrogenase family protein [Cupriavidus]|uniref:acyl-CoA dehydrogenase family protein n=1 Tax=Cupriavidus TaxID=106589 RepID=UPI000E7DACF3|nr:MULTISPECIES: acyl-CoA dehydrogenase family protein [Cupriavidus]UBM07898.1 acyl-CoA/acyl-ACP dehydrogenase [Cupriavidus metallidurans]GMG95075.1 acyl-CoA dehydrogenase [Cupriavidus sp. TKC]HBD35242.1 acyl-CoA dehydrogenase [Cupriavidus sp.]HBO79919.1 acyl-CoA dehydrogenase [Cupriavidus sp.]
MPYQLPTEDQTLAVESFRKFLQSEIKPVAREYRDRFIPKEKMRELTQRIAEFGLPGCSIPAELGGMGLTFTMQGMLFEELVACSCDIALAVMINLGLPLLLTGASQELRDRYMADALAGKIFSSVAISEPDVGSNVAEIKTRAVRDGDHYIINGEKTWISNGEYSDVVVVTCRTETGLSHILVDRHEHGYESRNIDKIALGSQSTAQLFFQDVRVPVTNLIGNEGEGLKNTMKLFEVARGHVGTLSIGLMRASLEESIAYAKDRKQFGKPIAAHQLVAAKIANMAMLLDASRLMCHRVFGLIDAGVRCDMEASMAKAFATEAAVRACRDAVQLHGGNGITKEFNVERYLREAIIIPIPDGTTEIQQLAISRALTGISAFA